MTGNTKKLAPFWRGPYTIFDKTSPVNYRLQIIGSNHLPLVVHHKRLKLCYGKPEGQSVKSHQNAALKQQEQRVQAVSNAPAGEYTSSEDPLCSPSPVGDPDSPSPPPARDPDPPDHGSRP